MSEDQKIDLPILGETLDLSGLERAPATRRASTHNANRAMFASDNAATAPHIYRPFLSQVSY